VLVLVLVLEKALPSTSTSTITSTTGGIERPGWLGTEVRNSQAPALFSEELLLQKTSL